MYVVAMDLLALVMIVAGVAIVARRSGAPDANGADRAMYARRIGGTMLAAFGLALGAIVTAFHFASG